ncbi:hypothetical protein Sliba_77690 [Streptomyces nigrescens]|uniref:Uncharacterized protein n=1 Tax=Streptomyces nigrescens TaxID=1920 RepID=A0A640TZF6_STRNI|nr:hypothetical protein Sliba_77690 [Streptomyces libani subsp. libani]GGV96480.1 hypothetical protein GCM10010500_39380 [Streptomyces libani subsp. libani]
MEVDGVHLPCAGHPPVVPVEGRSPGQLYMKEITGESLGRSRDRRIGTDDHQGHDKVFLVCMLRYTSGPPLSSGPGTSADDTGTT